MRKSFAAYLDLAFFARFLLVFLSLYGLHLFWFAVITPTGRVYSAFIENHLNYIGWLTLSVLSGAMVLVQLTGLQPSLFDAHTIGITGGASVTITWECLGFSITSFWIAFVMAQVPGWRTKMKWIFWGLAGIWCINCVRIALLLIAMQYRWQGNSYLDHHSSFNLASYALIICMIYLVTRRTGGGTSQAGIPA